MAKDATERGWQVACAEGRVMMHRVEQRGEGDGGRSYQKIGRGLAESSVEGRQGEETPG